MFLLPFRSSQAEIEWPSNLHPFSTEPANQDYTIAKYFLGNLKGGTSEHRTKFRLVPATGLEPVRCYSLEPESSASANSATRATGFAAASGIGAETTEGLRSTQVTNSRARAGQGTKDYIVTFLPLLPSGKRNSCGISDNDKLAFSPCQKNL